MTVKSSKSAAISKLFLSMTLTCSLLLIACTWRGAIWVEQYSTVTHLVFGVAERRLGSEPVIVRSMTLSRRVATEPHWKWQSVWSYNTSDIPQSRVLYNGSPLSAGYYAVSVELDRGRHGETEFTVDTMGNIVEHIQTTRE